MRFLFFTLLLCLCTVFVLGQALEFPAVPTKAKAGEYVLAAHVAAETITDKQTVIFYSRTMVAPGKSESKIKSPFEEMTRPNALIIRIPKGQTAKKGDILLTWWQSGSGMRRAIVVDAKDPKQPVVRYLVDRADKDEQLKPDSFVKLTEMLSPGSMVAVFDTSWRKFKYFDVISMTRDKIVGLGFAGKMALLEKAKCLPLPVKPMVKPGDAVLVKSVSMFSDAKVKQVDGRNGVIITEKGDTVPFSFVINPVQLCQMLLQKLGYQTGAVDGVLGEQTLQAIKKFQQDNTLTVDGQASMDLAVALYGKVLKK